MGLLSKIGKTLKFEFSHMAKFTKHILKNPWRGSFFLNTPLGTKFLNKITGKNYKPTIGQLGGSTGEERKAYEEKHGKGSLGFANATNAIANVIAGWYAGQGIMGVAGKGASALGMKGGAAAAAPGAATGAASVSPTATLGMPEAAAAGASAAAPAAAGAGASAAAPASAAAGAGAAGGKAGGFLSGLKNFATSEQGMAVIGGALQGFGSDLQQRRAIEQQNQYSRPFTSDEIASITGGMDVQVPGGYLSRAREISQFLTGSAPPTRTPEQVAAMARGGN